MENFYAVWLFGDKLSIHFGNKRILIILASKLGFRYKDLILIQYFRVTYLQYRSYYFGTLQCFSTDPSRHK